MKREQESNFEGAQYQYFLKIQYVMGPM